MMATWSHYAFRERLKSYAQRFTDVKVREVNEAYTSKTCGRCGEINHTLGSDETFRCAHCGLVSARDKHASRNILLRALPYILAVV